MLAFVRGRANGSSANASTSSASSSPRGTAREISTNVASQVHVFPHVKNSGETSPVRLKKVVVRDGDTAWEIAERFSLSFAELEALNPTIPDPLYPGDELLLPENAVEMHPSFTRLRSVKAKVKGTAPNAKFFDVFPPPRDVDDYRSRYRDLLDAMRCVESSFIMPAPVGDDGLSIGPLQISNDYHTDAWWHLSSRSADYSHCEHVEHSERTVVNYWLRYSPWALEFEDVETLARIHNGGPGFFRYISTATYWRKVKLAMRHARWFKGIPEMDPHLSASKLSVNGITPIFSAHLPFPAPPLDSPAPPGASPGDAQCLPTVTST